MLLKILHFNWNVQKFSIILDFETVPWSYMHGYPLQCLLHFDAYTWVNVVMRKWS